jgi:tetratricopeptide (TPR) repeat protein
MSSKITSSNQQAILQNAIALHQAGKLKEAADSYKQLLKQYPKDPDLLTSLGMVALQLGDFKECIKLLGQSLQFAPKQPQALCSRGVALQELKRHKEALINYDRAITLKPDYIDAYYNRGNTFKSLERFNEALTDFDKVISLDPADVLAVRNRGNTLQELNRFEEAINSYNQAIGLIPNHSITYYNRANALQELNRYEEAIASYDQALSLNPNYAEAHSSRGNALYELKRYEEALQSHEYAIYLNPNYAEAYSSLGSTLYALTNYADALANHDRALALNPNYAKAYSNRGNALRKLKQPNEALLSYNRAINLKPDFALAYSNRGLCLQELNRLADALLNYDRAIFLNPALADAYWNKALLKILTGHYEEGWKLYEWRWKHNDQEYFRHFSQPLWLGEEPLQDKTLLIHSEQGLGDIIQFCRYIHMAEARGAKVVFEAPKALISLLSSLKSNITLVEKGKALPPFDLQCPIMSLPLAFKTTLETIPAPTPYLFSSVDKQHIWHKKIGTKTKPRIGLAWSGSIGHKNDHNRSLLLKQLDPILQLPFEFHSLQKEIRSEDMETLSLFKDIQLHQDELIDFSDTAALINEMDLVISVDTSIAHLAGALNKTVWILLPFMPDYRWMLDIADSPWYPNALLFRQPRINDWKPVIDEVKTTLLKIF